MRITDRIKPLTGQVLIELLPPEAQSDGGIFFPEHTLSPEEVQMTHRQPELPRPHMGIVRAIGAWPKIKNGMQLMPEFGNGAKVIIRHNAGIQMNRNIGDKLRMVRNSEVLAVVTP